MRGLTRPSWDTLLVFPYGEYEKGVDELLYITFTCPGTKVEGTMRCPCLNCHNFFHVTQDDVKMFFFLLYICNGLDA